MDEDLTKDVMKYLGTRYIKVPRVIWDDLSSPVICVRRTAKVYYALFMECEYIEKVVVVRNREEICRVGEVITTYKELSFLTDMGVHAVQNYVKILVDKSLIKVSHVGDRTRFEVVGYKLFMKATSTPSNKKNGAANSNRSTSEQENQGIPGYLKNIPRTDLIEQELQ